MRFLIRPIILEKIRAGCDFQCDLCWGKLFGRMLRGTAKLPTARP